MNKNAQNPENVETNSTNFFNTLISKIMNKKIENVEELEASSTNTNKFGSRGTALMLVFMVIAFSAFTQINKKALSEVCFEFNTSISNPTDIQAANPNNYSLDEEMICLLERQTLCGLCFDEDLIPLNSNGLPDFNDPVLKSLVINNIGDPTLHGQTFTDPVSGKWVKLNFRARK